MGRVCLAVAIVFLLCGYCSAQCPTMWSTQPYQNSSDLDLSDTTNTPLGFLNDFLPEREISTELLTICVDVNVPGASNSRANYVFVAVESDGGNVCIRFEDSDMETCNFGAVFLCNQLVGTSVQITFFCEESCTNAGTFFYYKMETTSLEANDEGVWCATVDREVPSSLAANQATVEVPTTPPMTTEGAQGLSFTPLLMLSLLIGSVLLL